MENLFNGLDTRTQHTVGTQVLYANTKESTFLSMYHAQSAYTFCVLRYYDNCLLQADACLREYYLKFDSLKFVHFADLG